MLTHDLTSLMDHIGARFVFNGSKYPGYDELAPAQQQAFVLKHSLLHLNKSVGVIATQAESADHGSSIDTEQVKVATTKLLVSVLALAGKLGMSPQELASKIPEVMSSK
jgi:hypothetical protein